MTEQLFQLGSMILVASVLGVIARFLKQPTVLAYLATGALIGYLGLFNLADQATFRLFADLGIMFLLFLVGLEINYDSLRSVGRASLVLGVGQVVFTASIGYLLASWLGFAPIAAIYIAVALTFSSTIIIVKLLSEKRDLNSLYGKISVGMMLVQDFIAIILLVVLTGFSQEGQSVWLQVPLTVLKGIVLFALMMWLGRKILPFVFDRAAASQELLFLISLAWVFLLAALVSKIGFSIEIAGFLAGIALANSSEHFQISNKIRSLRDFFLLVFFVVLGSSILTTNLTELGWPVLIFSLFVLVGNPFIVIVLLGTMGYRRRTGFLVGVTVAQISEFSLVLAAMGEKLGHLNSSEVSLVTAVGIITITLSTYLILYAENLFLRISKYLKLFERKRLKEKGSSEELFQKPIILIGAHRTGQSILQNLPKEDLLVVDFDPVVAEELKRKGYDYLFGEINDPDILARANLSAARLVISTSPDLYDSLSLLEYLNGLAARPKIVVRAENEMEAKKLYASGADYVLLPHFTAGQYLGKTVALDSEMQILKHLKQHDLELIRKQRASVWV